MSITNRIIKNSFWLYAKMGVTMFLSLWTTRIILQGLGASDFGIYNVVGGAIGMLGFLNAAMAKATQRYMSYEEGSGNDKRKIIIFNVSIVLHIVVAILAGLLLIVAGYVFFHGLLNIPSGRVLAAQVVYGSLVISTVFTILTVPYDAVMNAHENMKYYAIIGIAESVLRLVVAFVCVYTSRDKLILYGILMSIIPIISVIVMRIYCHANYAECSINPVKYCNKNDLIEMTKFAGWNFVGSFSGMIGNYGQNIVANMFFGVIVNASFGVIQQLQGMMSVVANNMQKALNPVIVKKEGSGERDEMLQWTLRGCKFSCYLMLWIVIPMIIEAPVILQLWLKDVPQDTVLFFRLQMIRYLFEVIVCCLPTALMAVGQIKKMNIYQVFSLLLPLPLMCVLYSCGFGAHWMFIVYSISTFLFDLLLLRQCKKECSLKVSSYFGFVIAPVALTIATMMVPSLLCHLFIPNSILGTVLSFIVSWVFMIWALKCFGLNSEEKLYITNVINRLVSNKNISKI